MRIKVTASTQDEVVKAQLNAQGYASVTVSAAGLTPGETVDIFVEANGGWDTAKSYMGNAYQLTDTSGPINLLGGAIYAFDKSATGDPIAVEAVLVPGA